MINRFIIFCTLVLLVFTITTHAESHHPQKFLESISGSKNEGEQIYTHFCVNCHANKPLISLGAPKVGQESDWKLRLQSGLDLLFEHADNGFNAMPSRGGCFECTDKQLMLAILYMLPKHEKKTSIK